MESREDDIIVFETENGEKMEFTVMHEFCRDGLMYAMLQKAGSPGDTLIAEITDPLGPDEEFVPLDLKRQEEMLDFLRKGNSEEN
jgi:hypothetical protein